MKICHLRYVIRQGMGCVKSATKGIISIGERKEVMRYRVTRKASWGDKGVGLE